MPASSARPDQAAALFEEGFSCSQAVFLPWALEAGLDRDAALKISQALGGGMGHLGEACGAVTGAFLAIGLKHGRTKAGDLAARDRTYERLQAFAARFVKEFEGLRCPALLGVDIGTEAGMRAARERGLFKSRCAQFVRRAAEILDGVL